MIVTVLPPMETGDVLSIWFPNSTGSWNTL